MQVRPVNRSRPQRVVLMVLLVTSPLAAVAAVSLSDSVGGSVGLTSDYLVRGISRSDHQASVQADVHASLGKGIDAGVFAATVQIAPDQQRNTEVSGFIGFSKHVADAWHTRVAINHYSYPWNSAGSKYDYDELSLDVVYLEWLTFSAMYSPNTPRFLPAWGVVGVTAKSAELSAQAPLSRQFFLTGGFGYSHVAGRYADEYTYWSGGGLYSLGQVSISIQYVGSAGAARQLYYDSAARGRLTGTAIWRF